MKIEFCCYRMKSTLIEAGWKMDTSLGCFKVRTTGCIVGFCPFCGAKIEIKTKEESSV